MTIVEPNYDRPGGDYTVHYTNGWGPTLCEYYCATDSRCKAFTFVPLGGTQPAAIYNRLFVTQKRPEEPKERPLRERTDGTSRC